VSNDQVRPGGQQSVQGGGGQGGLGLGWMVRCAVERRSMAVEGGWSRRGLKQYVEVTGGAVSDVPSVSSCW
jgi:hypothetical protein